MRTVSGGIEAVKNPLSAFHSPPATRSRAVRRGKAILTVFVSFVEELKTVTYLSPNCSTKTSGSDEDASVVTGFHPAAASSHASGTYFLKRSRS
ncbi:MAG TPA: hypothetical protein PKI32_07080, partial [Opitutales bacterium]|nr:hypothetical protein [Opitutales bacterium]